MKGATESNITINVEPNVRIRGVREPFVKTKRVSVRMRTVESEWDDESVPDRGIPRDSQGLVGRVRCESL